MFSFKRPVVKNDHRLNTMLIVYYFIMYEFMLGMHRYHFFQNNAENGTFILYLPIPRTNTRIFIAFIIF